MEQGWDPDVKRYFRKILNTISVGLFWLMTAAAAGLYFGLAIPHEHFSMANIIFYVVLLLTFGLLIRYFFRLWKS